MDAFRKKFNWCPPAPTTFLLFGPLNGVACFVYVLQSQKGGTQYVGITSRLGRRVREHNRGDSRATPARRPWKLLYKERCEDHAAARTREEFLKSGAGHEWLASQQEVATRHSPVPTPRLSNFGADSGDR